MWTLPGYGDHLEERSPGLREQMAQMGAPEGFIDVVAALDPIADDDSETPAHWSVTFGVDDADATAAKARELGGEVWPARAGSRRIKITAEQDHQSNKINPARTNSAKANHHLDHADRRRTLSCGGHRRAPLAVSRPRLPASPATRVGPPPPCLEQAQSRHKPAAGG